MTKYLIAAVSVCLLVVVSAVSQTVVITKKRTVYRRPKPIASFKRTFVVYYPVVKASTPALSQKIRSNLSYQKVLDLNIREEIADIQWLEEADFEVNYNSRGVLVVTLSMNGTAAYPDGVSKTVVIDLKTGNKIEVADGFVELESLAALVKEKQKQEIERATKELKADPENKDFDPGQLFDGADFKLEDLKEYSVDNSKVTFIYDYGFPHAVEALQPEGRFSFTWSELSRFVKRSGQFAKFISK